MFTFLRIASLSNKLQSQDYETCQTAVAELVALKDARAVIPLINALSHQDWRVREIAAEALGQLRDARAVEPLVKALDDFSIRIPTALALAQLRDKRAVETLIKVVWDYRSSTSSTPSYQKAKDNDVCKRAATALGNLGDERATEILLKLLNHDDETVRQTATDALVQIRPIEQLAKMMRDSSLWDFQRREAAIGLEKLGDARGTEWLKNNKEKKVSDYRPVQASLASCATRSDLFNLNEEVKCRCYYTIEDLAESFHALSKLYSGRIETRKATTGVQCPFLLITEASERADDAALRVDRQFGSKWGDYHIMRPGKIYDQSEPLKR